MFEHLITRNGKKSSTKTLTLACWVVGTIVILVLLYRDKLTSDIFTTYLAVFVLNQMASTATNAYQQTRLNQPTDSIRRRDME